MSIQELDEAINRLDIYQTHAALNLFRSFQTAKTPEIQQRADAGLTALLGNIPPHFYALLGDRLKNAWMVMQEMAATLYPELRKHITK